MTWIGEFKPRNKTIWVVFDEESEFSGPRTPKLRPDQVCLGKASPVKNYVLISFVLLLATEGLTALSIPHLGNREKVSL